MLRTITHTHTSTYTKPYTHPVKKLCLHGSSGQSGSFGSCSCLRAPVSRAMPVAMSQQLRALTVFVEDLDSIPSIYMVFHKHLQFYRTRCPLLTSMGTRHLYGT